MWSRWVARPLGSVMTQAKLTMTRGPRHQSSIYNQVTLLPAPDRHQPWICLCPEAFLTSRERRLGQAQSLEVYVWGAWTASPKLLPQHHHCDQHPAETP